MNIQAFWGVVITKLGFQEQSGSVIDFIENKNIFGCLHIKWNSEFNIHYNRLPRPHVLLVTAFYVLLKILHVNL